MYGLQNQGDTTSPFTQASLAPSNYALYEDAYLYQYMSRYAAGMRESTLV